MTIEIIAAAAVAVVGYVVYRRRKAIATKVEAEAKALKTTAETELKKVESKF